MIAQIVIQEELQMSECTLLKRVECLRIIEVDSEIVGFMEYSTQRRLDDLEVIGANRRLWLLGECRKMVNQEMMQTDLILSCFLEPRPDPEEKILRETRADQEDPGMRDVMKIAPHHFVKGTS